MYQSNHFSFIPLGFRPRCKQVPPTGHSDNSVPSLTLELLLAAEGSSAALLLARKPPGLAHRGALSSSEFSLAGATEAVARTVAKFCVLYAADYHPEQ